MWESWDEWSSQLIVRPTGGDIDCHIRVLLVFVTQYPLVRLIGSLHVLATYRPTPHTLRWEQIGIRYHV